MAYMRVAMESGLVFSKWRNEMTRKIALIYGKIRKLMHLERYKILFDYWESGMFYLIYDSYRQVYVVGSGSGSYDGAVAKLSNLDD